MMSCGMYVHQCMMFVYIYVTSIYSFRINKDNYARLFFDFGRTKRIFYGEMSKYLFVVKWEVILGVCTVTFTFGSVMYLNTLLRKIIL